MTRHEEPSDGADSLGPAGPLDLPNSLEPADPLKPAESLGPADPLDLLDERSRRPRPRIRIGLGAAAVLTLAAAVGAVVIGLSGGGDSGRVTTVTASTSAPSLRSSSAPPAGSSTARAAAGPGPSSTAAAGILVHVAGAVRDPGLYRLAAGSRVVDAVAAAGGFAKHAVKSGVNLARALADGEQLVVPSTSHPVAGARGTSTAGGGGAGAHGAAADPAAGTAPVNLNTATAEQLEALPRIGPAMAARILAWRRAHGRFSRVEQLMEVSGIGQKTFDGLKDSVTV